MKKLFRIVAVIMAALCLSTAGGCRSSETPPEESTAQETSMEENSDDSLSKDGSSEGSKASQQSKASKDESSKKNDKKKESSKEKEGSDLVSADSYNEYSYADTVQPHLGPVYVDSSREVLSDLSSYYASNHDTVGWVKVPNTLANDVVLQYKDDAYEVAYGRDPYYLYKDFYGNYYYPGSLFLDYRSSIESKNQLIHGHSMANGTMFAGLLSYESLSFYQAGPVITYDTIYNSGKWKIIAISNINTNEEIGTVYRYLRSTFASDYDFLNYVHEMRSRSVINCPVTVNENDTLVTLSTCTGYSYGVDGLRLVVLARKVRPGEDSRVNVSDACYNPNPLQPDIYYRYYGGSKPVVTSFQEALNKKQIDWYDGKRKWSSKDDEALAKALTDAKKNAYTLVQKSYVPEEYYQNEINQINNIINIYKPYVDDAKDFARVNDLVLQELAAIGHVQKKPEDVLKAEAKQREEEEKRRKLVEKTRKEIITALENYVKGKHYRDAQQKKVDSIIERYKEKVYATEDLDVLAEMKENSMKLISSIQTDEQLTAKEKAAAKKSG